MKISFHPEAESELLEAVRFYQLRVAGLGLQFLENFQNSIRIILADPEKWRMIDSVSEVRRYLMPRFPYTIFYRVLPGKLRVLAIKHHKRRPGYWHGRISE